MKQKRRKGLDPFAASPKFIHGCSVATKRLVMSREITSHGWHIASSKRPILNAEENDVCARQSNVPLPEICFGNNALTITYQTLSYSFNMLDALQYVDHTGQRPGSIKVAHSKAWMQARKGHDESSMHVVNPFDWTYTTTYPGTSSVPFYEDPTAAIPMDKLASQSEPILFFEEIPLFEDELHDCGIADLTVRIRVMPSCLFILSRFFLRVDQVLFRVFDVRLYHEFGSDHVIRQLKGRENTYDNVRKLLPQNNPNDLSPLSDHNWVAQKLGMLSDQPGNASDWPGVITKVETAKLPA